jgi:hypothetical protein
VPDKHPIILTEKQHEALIHCTRLRRGLKARLEQSEPGAQVVLFTRKELDEFQDEVGQPTYYAVSPYKKPLLAVVKKVADAFEAETAKGLALRERKAIGGDTIFQLKVTLLGTKPSIWRQVQVKDCTLAKLHGIIQVAVGWTNDHMHYFEVGGERYTEPAMIGDLVWMNGRKVKVSQIVRAGHRKFTYVYDMGDNWGHAIQVEKTLTPEPKAEYPRCVSGARACPPEDCGGVWGYEEFLEAITDKRHVEHKAMLEWVGGVFDPDEFEVVEVNRELARMR